MTLPDGQFWCWKFNDESPIYWRADDAYGKAHNAERCYSDDWWAHIFGVCPKPGEVMLLDNTGAEWQCPDHSPIKMDTDWTDDGQLEWYCPKCHERAKWLPCCIITRKTLEDANA